ncbi:MULTISPECIES: cell wall metabolism sensor histidine kinase WalK [unclassified Pseudomonas]|jgi:signal transduction histidine kinase|uniref:sensor histidine kinase n=1 Tax=unclassified Pseudomonas TaxID=196821 RepID=UPI000C2FB331|nr:MULTISPECIES: ATP-binding protein [unclassified Pseudomonas]MCU1739310.1 ATP-binding protein [Pseudomonas sp. 20S_6.2_Bac1]
MFDISKTRQKPLWRWVGMRMSLLAIGAVVAIAIGMWLHFMISDWATLHRMPLDVRLEFENLRAHPHLNEARLWELSAQYYNVEDILPGIANKDWFLLASLVVGAIPIIIVCGFMFSRPLSSQFSAVAKAARQVAQGDFITRLPPSGKAPQELQRLVSDFNSMTTQLERYEREVRESSAVIAHELRTPLNAAMGRVQGMIDEVFPHDINQLEMVKRQLGQLNKLVDDLHLLSLARAGQLALDKTEFPLHKLVFERLAWFSTSLKNASIAHVVEVPTHLNIQADRDRMGQVVNILIDNFLRYAVPGGELHISATASENKIVLVCADRGPGFEQKDLDRVFDRFWRAEHSRARHSGGSGLGLSIARAICLAHGGNITADNRSGGGAIICVEIPFAHD